MQPPSPSTLALRPSVVSLEASPSDLPWHALDAEEAVISAVMLDNESYLLVASLLEPRHFFSSRHRYIWEAITNLAARNAALDAVTIAEELRRQARLLDAGGIPYLAHVVDATPAVANLEAHALIVRQAWQMRELGNVAERIALYTRRAVGNVPETLARAERAVLEITQLGVSQHRSAHIGDAIREAFVGLEQLGKGSGMSGLSTGFQAIDAMTGGIGEVDMMVLGGRPGLGKTSLACNIAVNVAAMGGGVQIFSYELLKSQLVTRLFCAEAQVDSRKLRQGRLTADDWRDLTQAALWQQSLPIWIDDDASISVAELKARAIRRANDCERAGTPLKLVIVDYLQMVKPPPLYGRTREQEVAEVARELKRLAKTLRVPVLALVAIGRESEKQNRRPRMGDIRESGNIESDTDVAAFLYADKDTPPGCASLHFDKNRNGKTGTVHIMWQPVFTRFSNYEAGPDGSDEVWR